MSRVLDSHRLADYRRKIRDPRYLAHALVQVASVLVDMLAAPERTWPRGHLAEHDRWSGVGSNN